MGEFPHFPAGLILLASDMARVTWPGGAIRAGSHAAAEQVEHGTNTAFVGVQPGRVLGVGAEDLGAVFSGALVKD